MTAKTENNCSDWHAWHDNQPGGPPTLYVTGKCTFPDGGYTVELKPHVPPGINPTIYVLDKIVHKPAHVNHIPTVVDVRYTEKTKTHYGEVQILPDNVTVPVKEVQ